MKKINSLILLAAVVIGGCSCTDPVKPEVIDPDPGEEIVEPEKTSLKWDFDSLDGWVYTHQDTASVNQWSIQNGNLVLSTRKGTYDRTKVYTLQDDFTTGEYTWRINVPNISAGDQVSIAGFIYQDDHHEIDFEIGYGAAKVREEYAIPSGSMVACMTNQDFPFSSTYTAIKPGWHTFTIKLDLKSGFYVAHWIIDGEETKSLDLDFDPSDAKFRVYCSVENLLFMGDHVSTKDYSARFDHAEFVGDVTGSYRAPSGLEEMTVSLSSSQSLGSGSSLSFFDLLGNREFKVSADGSSASGKAYATGKYTVLYPYDAEASLNGNVVTTRIPGVVEAVGKQTDIMMLAASAVKDDSANLDNVMSAVSFTLAEDMKDVQEVVFESISGESISGTVNINCGAEESHSIRGASSIKVVPSGDAKIFEAGRTYFFPVVSGEYKGGFRVSFNAVESSKVKDYPKMTVLSPDKVSDLGTVSSVVEYEVTRWDFDNDINGWYYYTHSSGQTDPHYRVENGYVRIWTDANTMQRNKLHTTAKNYGAGEYEFRLYVSDVAPGEKCSIGAFIYQDDKHELDFEIGYGTASARKSCGAKEGEMVACMTNQGGPFNSTYTPITVGWHTCIIKLELVGSRYKASWIIDGQVIKTLNLSFGSETKFLISVSVENLEFMGDFQPEHENYGLFDYVIYRKPLN